MPLSSRKPKTYKACKECGKQYQAWSGQSSLNRFCSPLCAAMWGGRKRDEARLKHKRKERAQARESLKTRNDWVKEAQVAFNAYIRERDYGKPCISCGISPPEITTLTRQSFDAGHYRSRGAAPHLRFDLRNCHSQCKKCNRDLSGNVVEMRKGVALRIGVDRLKALEEDNAIRKYRIEDLKRIKRIFTKRAKLYRRFREQGNVRHKNRDTACADSN